MSAESNVQKIVYHLVNNRYIVRHSIKWYFFEDPNPNLPTGVNFTLPLISVSLQWLKDLDHVFCMGFLIGAIWEVNSRKMCISKKI